MRGFIVPVEVGYGDFAAHGSICAGVAHEEEGDSLRFVAGLVTGSTAGAGVVAGDFPVFVFEIAAVIVESEGGKRQRRE